MRFCPWFLQLVLTSFSWFINVLLILLTVAFFTLFERKVMGLVHLRVGPNKVSFLGLLQPLYDAFKLLSKQNLVSLRANKFVYALSPQLSLMCSVLLWILLPTYSFMFSNSYSILVFMLIGSVMVFSNLLAGWASNSKYTFIGSLRSVAQSVSYEAVLTTLILAVVLVSTSYSFCSISSSISFIIFLIFPLWAFSVLAETHRAPFDFAESESELVSGYNTEYSGAYFAFVFLAEYSALLFSCSVIVVLFFGYSQTYLGVLANVMLVLLISFMFIIVRVTYCRFRYDFLMSLAWKSLLPISLYFLILTYFI